MSDPNLTFQQLARHLGDLPDLEPSAGLWPRIADAQRLRVRRTRARRLTSWCGGGVLVLAALFGTAGDWLNRSPASAPVDWQARAQALELELRTLDAAATAHPANALAVDAQNELVVVDGALQAAYDEGADARRVNALWQRRSELLGALLHAHRQNVQISRI